MQATRETESDRPPKVPRQDSAATRAAVASDADRSLGWPDSAKAVLLAGAVGAGLLALLQRDSSSVPVAPLGGVEPHEIIRRWAVRNGHMPSLGALDAGVVIVERNGQAGRVDAASAAAVVGSLIAHVDDPDWSIARWEEVVSQLTNRALRLDGCTK